MSFLDREDVSLMPVKLSIKAVILNDMEMLKDAIENREEVYTVHRDIMYLRNRCH